MNKADAVRSNAIAYSGGLTMLLQTERMTFATSADSNNGRAVLPFDAYIERFYYSIITTSTATGSRTINVGSAGDADAFIAGHVVALPDAAEMREVDLTATDGTIVTRTIPAGTEVQFELPAGIAGGVISGALVVTPV